MDWGGRDVCINGCSSRQCALTQGLRGKGDRDCMETRDRSELYLPISFAITLRLLGEESPFYKDKEPSGMSTVFCE